MTTDELLQLFTGEKAYRATGRGDPSRPQRRTGFAGRIVAVAGRGSSRAANRRAARLRHGRPGRGGLLVQRSVSAAGRRTTAVFPDRLQTFDPIRTGRSVGDRTANGGAERRKNNDGGALALCTYPGSAGRKVVGQQQLRESILTLRRGDRLSTAFVEEILTTNRFERVDFVYEPGQYSVRGGIIDIFSFSSNVPYRIDFFGDEIDSIRPFDISTQLSTGKLAEVEIVPNLKDIANASARVSFATFAGQAVYWIADGEYTLKRFNDIRTKILGDLENPSEIDRMVTSRKEFLENSGKATFILLNDNITERAADVRIAFNTSPQPQFNKNFELLAEDITRNRENGYETFFLTENKAQLERLGNIFNSIGAKQVRFGSVPLTLHAGFIDHISQKCFYTDHQIFDRYQRYRIRGELDRSESLTIQELNSLKVGDYVVHIDHGVGRFGGLTRTVENGKVHEAIKLVYRDNDVLLVNVHALHRISKYKDKESEPPKIYKLGSAPGSG